MPSINTIIILLRKQEMEKKVHKLIEESAEAMVTKDSQRALEKAKEAGKAERGFQKILHSLLLFVLNFNFN